MCIYVYVSSMYFTHKIRTAFLYDSHTSIKRDQAHAVFSYRNLFLRQSFLSHCTVIYLSPLLPLTIFSHFCHILPNIAKVFHASKNKYSMLFFLGVDLGITISLCCTIFSQLFTTVIGFKLHNYRFYLYEVSLSQVACFLFCLPSPHFIAS